jgi:hypothetical protein
MKTLKIMSIIALVWFGLALICLVAFNNSYDYESAIGWGILAVLYGIPYAIVALTQSKK